MNNLKQMGLAAAMYTVDHTNSPPDLQSLTGYLNAPRIFVCPSTGHSTGTLARVQQWTDYVMVTGASVTTRPDSVMMYCPRQNHKGNGGNILCADGHVEWCTNQDVWTQLERSAK